MKIIIAGGNGFIGRSLIQRFINSGAEVLGIDISFSAFEFKNSKQLTLLETDLEKIDFLKSLINVGEYDLFYNLAWRGVNGPEKADPFIQMNNIINSLRCADLAHFLKCKKYLCAGTIAERSIESLPRLNKTNGGMMYGAAKRCNQILLETYCKNIGLDCVWMQFSNVFGPNNKTGNLISYTLSQLEKDEPAFFGPANQPYDFIYIDDLIEAAFRLGVNPTKRFSYFIGSGTPRRLSDYLLTVGTITNKTNLIRIGERSDDGIKYSYEMLDCNPLIEDIGQYVTGSFEEQLRKTMKGFQLQ